MKLVRPFILLVSVSIFALAGCQNEKAEVSPSVSNVDTSFVDSAVVDSDALVLSLTPTVDCLPFYYAKKAGLFKSLGLKVCLKTYQSQFDCDTAMLGKTAIGGSTDLVRLHYHADKGDVLSAVSSLNGQSALYASGDLRINKISLLEERMIAVARFSASDFFSERALAKVGMDYHSAFRPQVNNYYLRSAMLKNHQIDAAVLPEPFATQARLAGHKELFRTTSKEVQLGCLVFKPSVLAVKDSARLVTRLLEGYNQAVVDLNRKGKPACTDILLKDFKMKPMVVDSLVLPKFQKAKLPTEEAVAASRKFLKDHGRGNHIDQLNLIYSNEILPQ